MRNLPWLGIESVIPALGAWSLNYWTTREVLFVHFLHIELILYMVLGKSHFFFLPVRLKGSSLTRDWIWAVAVNVLSPNHWTTVEFPGLVSFTCGYLVFPAPCVEKTVLSLLNGLGTLVSKSVGHINYIFFNNPEENKLTVDVKLYLEAL